MSRLIFLIAIAALVYLLIKSYSRKIPEKKQDVTESMVKCLQCGVHLPAGESLRDGERVFCSKAHRDSYQK
jgi:uncharacterized protein